MGKKLSIREIAEKTSLSIATVSRALDPRFVHKVKEETRLKILRYCNECDYRPNNAGRSLVTGKTFKVGFISGQITGDLGDKHFSYYFQGLCNTLQSYSYSLVLLNAALSTNCSEKVVDLLLSRTADAYIMGKGIISGDVYKALQACGVPVLVLGNMPPAKNLISIQRDLSAAYREIWAQADPAWNGKILFCCRNEISPSSMEKYRACFESAPAGLKPELLSIQCPDVYYVNPDTVEKNAEAFLEKLLEQKLILCDTDILALGIRQCLAKHGFTAGRDYALVGFDNLSRIKERILCGLATVDSRWEAMGEESAKMILDSIRDPEKREKKLFPASFVPGETFPLDLPDRTEIQIKETECMK